MSFRVLIASFTSCFMYSLSNFESPLFLGHFENESTFKIII
jgi:hypothetical protein